MATAFEEWQYSSFVSKDEAAKHDAAPALYNLSLCAGGCRVMLAQGVIRGPLMRAARRNMMKHDEVV